MWLDYEFESYFREIGDIEKMSEFEKESEDNDYGEDEDE